jgi:hypothetical protein
MRTMAKIDSKKILEKLETKDDRGAVSFYVSKSLLKRFKKACGKAPFSRVMEELMQNFIDDVDSQG